MLDESLRRLERRAKETLSPLDEATWLRTRVRVGELDAKRLELAAHLGYEAACLASDRIPAPPSKDWSALRAWATRISEWGLETSIRAGLADAERCVRTVRAAAGGETSGWPIDLREHLDVNARVATSRIDALAAWLLLPGNSSLQALARIHEDRSLDVPPIDPRSLKRARLAQSLARTCSEALLATTVMAEAVLERRAFFVGEWWSHELEPALAAKLTPKIRTVIRRDVAPWALGLGDPLSSRTDTVLDRLEIASPCDAKWESMTPLGEEGRARWCGKCRLPVFDISAMTRSEALELLREREGSRLCARLFHRADGRVLTRDCPLGLGNRSTELTKHETARQPRVFGGIW